MQNPVDFVSLIRLIQAPEQYHEARVRVVGYGALGFERKAVYVSAEDLKHAVTKNAIWLSVQLTDEVLKLDKQYILVEGTFDKNNRGHLKMYSGAIRDIDRIVLWSKDADGSAAPPAPAAP